MAMWDGSFDKADGEREDLRQPEQPGPLARPVLLMFIAACFVVAVIWLGRALPVQQPAPPPVRTAPARLVSAEEMCSGSRPVVVRQVFSQLDAEKNRATYVKVQVPGQPGAAFCMLDGMWDDMMAVGDVVKLETGQVL